MNIQLVPVTSSQIKATGYDPASETMRVQFVKGDSVYEYGKVPASLYAAMIAAPSVGAFFAANIKNNPQAYPFTKVE